MSESDSCHYHEIVEMSLIDGRVIRIQYAHIIEPDIPLKSQLEVFSKFKHHAWAKPNPQLLEFLALVQRIRKVGVDIVGILIPRIRYPRTKSYNNSKVILENMISCVAE